MSSILKCLVATHLLMHWMSVYGWTEIMDKMPLRGVDNLHISKSTPGCWLGETFYNLEETWHPELEPQGVMFCIICQCVPVVKKNVLQKGGKVTCNNIKTQCPVPDCPNPNLEKGQCCKTCPGQGPPLFKSFVNPRTLIPPPSFNQGVFADVSPATQDFVALLTGQSELTNRNTRAVGSGHFTLYRNSLIYSLQYVRLRNPVHLWFSDQHGSLLYERALTPKSKTNSICGTWHRLPGIYRRYLLEGKLHVMIASKKYSKGEISGVLLALDDTVEKETFSSLLSPNSPDGSGVLASLRLTARGTTLSFVLYSVGLPAQKNSKKPKLINLMSKGRTIGEVSLTDVGHNKPLVGQWKQLPKRESRYLVQGKMTIVFKNGAGSLLRGKIFPRSACNGLQAVLTSRGYQNDSQTTAVGAAVFSLTSNGQIHYQLTLGGLNGRVSSAAIETATNKKGKRKKVCKIPKSKFRKRSKPLLQVQGQCTRTTGRYIHMLLQEQLFINVITRDVTSQIGGPITQMLYNDDIRLTENRFLLTGSGVLPAVQTSGAGQAWLSMDDKCTAHYQVFVTGLTQNEGSGSQVLLATSDNKHKVFLGELLGNMVMGAVSKLPRVLLKELNSGKAKLFVTTKNNTDGEIGVNIALPNRCGVKPKPQIDQVLNDASRENSHEKSFGKYDCRFEDRVFPDGESWVPSPSEECKTCSCKRGKVICHQAVCPPLTCQHPIKVAGECCPQCLDEKNISKKSCFFNGDKRRHRFGVIWHPYIPPFGYSQCVVCQCVEGESDVNCTRLACPPLKCAESEAVRKSASACCKECVKGHPSRESRGPNMPNDDSSQGGCTVMGARHADGEIWHPRIPPYGIIHCVTCECKNGRIRYTRKRCPKGQCQKRQTATSTSRCCPLCSDTSSYRRRMPGRRRREKKKE